MMNSTRLDHPYNPSLDGIRALAVAVVLLYHGGFTTGGFLGVDVFFVLSGFLIANLLIAELWGTGQIGLLRFWGNRARRLLPAMVAVALFVVIALPLLDVPVPTTLGWDLVSMFTYTSNWWFMASDQAYGATAPTPVLHAWSLAVEEQWYVMFPIILLVVFIATGRRLGAWLGPCLLVGAGLSAAWTALLAHSGASLERIYFGTDTRVQGLLLGAAMAAFLALPYESLPDNKSLNRRLPSDVRSVVSRLRGVSGWGALAGLGILVAVTAVSDRWLLNGGLLAAAALASLLILSVAPQPAPWSPARLLSSRPLVAVGLVSYGLYLWHFPVYMWITSEKVGFGGVALLSLRLAMTGVLAVVSYVLIEQPVRRGGLWAGDPGAWAKVTAVGAAAFLALGVAIIRLPDRHNDDYVRQLGAQTATPSATPLSATETMKTKSTEVENSGGAAGEAKSKRELPKFRSVLLVGDSVALSLLPAVRADTSVTSSIATRFGCGTIPFDATAEGVILRPEEPLCSDWDSRRASEIAAQPSDIGLLYLGPWEQYDRWIGGRGEPVGGLAWTQATVDDYRRVIDEMIPHVARIAVVLNHCRDAPNADLPVEMMYRSGRFAPVVNDLKRVKATNDALRRAILDVVPRVQVLDPNSEFCLSGSPSNAGGVTVFGDGVHFTEPGAQLMWKWIASELRSYQP